MSRRRQQGLALMVMVVVMIVGSSYILVRQLNSAAQRMNSTAASANVLAQAKEALIGYAAIKSGGRPGALPCPDLSAPGSNTEGEAAGTCNSNVNQRVGRLPWKTLGIPDLRDASGERLWYALSANFFNIPASAVVNSDTPGTLILNGVAAPSSPTTATSLANSIVAIVFAPGAAIGEQSRNPGDSSVTTVSNYLDGENGDIANNNDTFVSALTSDGVDSSAICGSRPTPCAFNDALLAITHADLFTVVENIVAKRIETEVKPFIQSYATQWNAYPFAFPAFPPQPPPGSSQDLYKGTLNTTYGLLPLTLDTNFLAWRAPTASEQLVVQTSHVGSATGTVTSDCSSARGTNPTQFKCFITSVKTGGTGGFQPYFSVTATLKNVGMALVDYSQIFVVSGAGSAMSFSSTNGSPVEPQWTSNTLRTDGGADMLFTNGRLRATGTSIGASRTVTLTINWSSNPSPYLYTSSQPSDWFFKNEWYRMTYYAISAGYGPAKGRACTVTNPCLATVANPAAGDYNKGAILVFAGRAGKKADGTDQTRPSSSLDDYFEGENMTAQTPSDRIYESGTRSGIFNDKIVVLAP